MNTKRTATVTPLILEPQAGFLTDSLSVENRNVFLDLSTGLCEMYDAAGVVIFRAQLFPAGNVYTTPAGDIIDIAAKTWSKAQTSEHLMRIKSPLIKNSDNVFVDQLSNFSMSLTDLTYLDGAGTLHTASDQGAFYATLFGNLIKDTAQSSEVRSLVLSSFNEVTLPTPLYLEGADILHDNTDPENRRFELNTMDGSWRFFSPLGNVLKSSVTEGVATEQDGIWILPTLDIVDANLKVFEPGLLSIWPTLYRTKNTLTVEEGEIKNGLGFWLDKKTGVYSGLNLSGEPTKLVLAITGNVYTLPNGFVELTSATTATFTEGSAPASKTYPQERDENISSHMFGLNDQLEVFEYSKVTKFEGAGGVHITTHLDRQGVVTIDGSGIQPVLNDSSLTGQTNAENLAVSGDFTIAKRNFKPSLGVYDGQESVPESEKFPGNTFFIRTPNA